MMIAIVGQGRTKLIFFQSNVAGETATSALQTLMKDSTATWDNSIRLSALPDFIQPDFELKSKAAINNT